MDRGYDTRSPIQKKSSVPRTYRLFCVHQYSMWIVCGLVLFATVAHSPLFIIRSVIVEGGEITPSESVQAATAALLDGLIVNPLPYNSIISVPVRTLEKKIDTLFPSISGVTVKRSGISQLYIYVQEHGVERAYCVATECVALNQNNVPVALVSPNESREKMTGNISEFLRRSDVLGVHPIAFDAPLLSQSAHTVLMQVRAFLMQEGFRISEIKLHPLGFFDIIAYADSHRVEFRFRDDGHINTQVFELQLAFSEGLKNKVETGDIEYVILYIPQKVIYKTKT